LGKKLYLRRPLITAVTGLPVRFYRPWRVLSYQQIVASGRSSGSSPVMAGSKLLEEV
jgi:hypothetical protein